MLPTEKSLKTIQELQNNLPDLNCEPIEYYDKTIWQKEYPVAEIYKGKTTLGQFDAFTETVRNLKNECYSLRSGLRKIYFDFLDEIIKINACDLTVESTLSIFRLLEEAGKQNINLINALAIASSNYCQLTNQSANQQHLFFLIKQINRNVDRNFNIQTISKDGFVPTESIFSSHLLDLLDFIIDKSVRSRTLSFSAKDDLKQMSLYPFASLNSALATHFADRQFFFWPAVSVVDFMIKQASQFRASGSGLLQQTDAWFLSNAERIIRQERCFWNQLILKWLQDGLEFSKQFGGVQLVQNWRPSLGFEFTDSVLEFKDQQLDCWEKDYIELRIKSGLSISPTLELVLS
jgi:hypothetical protein